MQLGRCWKYQYARKKILSKHKTFQIFRLDITANFSFIIFSLSNIISSINYIISLASISSCCSIQFYYHRFIIHTYVFFKKLRLFKISLLKWNYASKCTLYDLKSKRTTTQHRGALNSIQFSTIEFDAENYILFSPRTYRIKQVSLL